MNKSHISDVVIMTKLLSLLLLVLPYLSGRITLINVGNLSEDRGDTGQGDADQEADNNTIVVGVLLPKNIEGNNDVVAKARVSTTKDFLHVSKSQHGRFTGCNICL